uniref:Uncharacterized protein n=1 Tax=viral metagenome TaxID=1070528 RepID=A0A6C0KV25_9ZZZZ
MFQDEALTVLSHHHITPQQLLIQLCAKPLCMIQLPDQQNRMWTFVSRQRCGLYLMAKTSSMKQFEELYHTRCRY